MACGWLGVWLLALVGCGDSTPPAAPRKPPGVFDFPGNAPAAPTTERRPAPPATESVKAEVGVGEKGRGYGGGMITEPIHQYFAAKERIAFEIELPKAMQLYQATHDKLPPSHEAFMRDIIEANQIKLPQLPEGHTYKYDPKSGELMVERPTDGNQDGK
jgi:hypothetical protein